MVCSRRENVLADCARLLATCPGTPDAGNLHVRCDGGGAGGNAGPRYPTEGIPLEVHDATLESRLGQLVTNRGSESRVPVGDDELDAAEAAAHELLEKIGPAFFRLARPDGDAEKLAVPARADAVGDEGRDVLDAAGPAGVEERAIEEQVCDGLGDRRLAQRFDLLVEGARDAADRRATDVIAEERAGDLAHLARRHTSDVRLDDRGVHLAGPALVAADDARR